MIDGSIPTAEDGLYSTSGGVTNLQMLQDAAEGAAAIIAVGTCAAFGGIPKANPNPTGAVAVSDIIKDKPIVNVSGCPPIPAVIAGVLVEFLTFGRLPELDALGRPKTFYGNTIHDRCYRRPFYERGQFAESFDDEGAKQGWCLYKLGCKGPVTYNACATVKWNDGTSFPIQAGHGCIGCAEPNFWDKGGFYQALPQGTMTSMGAIGAAAAAGAALGAGAAMLARGKQKQAQETKRHDAARFRPRAGAAMVPHDFCVWHCLAYRRCRTAEAHDGFLETAGEHRDEDPGWIQNDPYPRGST